MRGDLVNVCIPGDVLRLVGIVKATQGDVRGGGGGGGGGGGRGGGRGRGGGGGGVGAVSGLHQRYLVANSLQCVKASGDRGATAAAAAPSQRAAAAKAAGLGLGRPTLAAFTPAELAAVRAVALLAEPSSSSPAAPPGACLGLLTASLCPAIFGHELVKFGLLLALFGGTRGGTGPGDGAPAGGGGGGGGGGRGGMHVRSDVHVLVVGDPGLGKV